jgi:F-type H+-transporting ATPase subunit b
MGSVVSLSALIRVLAAGAAEHGEAPSLADPLISHWLWTWIIFGVVFLILWRFAFRPIREQLEARENRIRETVEKADQVKNEAVALLDKHREMMDRAKADAQEVLNEGRLAAERVKKEAMAAGHMEAQEILDRAHKEIDLHKKKAIDEIRQETVELTLLAASKVLERSITDDDHRRLTGAVIDEIGEERG